MPTAIENKYKVGDRVRVYFDSWDEQFNPSDGVWFSGEVVACSVDDTAVVFDNPFLGRCTFPIGKHDIKHESVNEGRRI